MHKSVYFTLMIMIGSAVFFASSAIAAEEFPVSPPPITEGMFPCSNCHASMEVNRKKRELKDEHTSIKLHHAETMRWCLDCHDAKNRDKLRLYNGELINFTGELPALRRMPRKCLQGLEGRHSRQTDGILFWWQAGPTSSAPTAMTPMSLNSSRSRPEPPPLGPSE